MNAIRLPVTSFGNETRKGLLVAWSEKLQILLELPFFALFVLMQIGRASCRERV